IVVSGSFYREGKIGTGSNTIELSDPTIHGAYIAKFDAEANLKYAYYPNNANPKLFIYDMELGQVENEIFISGYHKGEGYDISNFFLAKIKEEDGLNTNFKKVKGYNFIIFPNPARNQLNIHYQPKTSTNNINFHIYNSTGMLVYSATLSGNENIAQAIDISSFSSGVYFVNLIDGGERVARKFVVSR
nr:T9SS type A sorting domain-containing protein [Bacteroidota bacterium]